MKEMIRRLWGSVINRLGSSSSSSRNSMTDYDRFVQMMYAQSSSTGDFDRLPFDIFVQILSILGPRDCARLRMVCKSWKFLVADNRLWMYFLQNQPESWESIFFAETHLRSGHPIQIFPAQVSDMSYMQIFGQRMQVPGAIIIDGGSGYTKFGFSKYISPSGRSMTFLEFGNIESPMPSKLRNFYSTICSRMQVKTSTQPVVVSLPLCHYDDTVSAKASRRQLKQAIYSSLFDMNVPAVCAISQATLVLFAARRTSGIVVNIGFNYTSVVPILNGKVMYKVGVEVVGMGASKLTSFLRNRMQQNNIQVDSPMTVKALKENLCYVALDYEAELCKDTKASFGVTSTSWFTLSSERFQTGEILFKPRMAGEQAMGLHQAVALCMGHCHDAELSGDNTWYKTVILAGGTACLPGLAERLKKELHEHLPISVSKGIRVFPPPVGADSAWHGAKLVSNLSTFLSNWCVTKKQFSKQSKLLW